MNHKKQVARAWRWLAHLSLPPDATEPHIQRLFGVCAGLVLDDHTPPTIARRRIQRIVAKIRPFAWSRYKGDPIFALAARRMLIRWNLSHPSLDDYYLGCSKLSIPQGGGFEARYCLFFDLCANDCAPHASTGVTIPLIEPLLQAGRPQLLDFCRSIMCASSCGMRRLKLAGDMGEMLPKLCCSYATDWDLSATCILMRACAYLGLRDAPSCSYAKCWLLDQQSFDGSFGLLFPGDRSCQQTKGERPIDFLPTTEVLWTLAEMQNPGFMLHEIEGDHR